MYTKEGTLYRYHAPTGALLFETLVVGFLVDREMGCYLKHGPPEFLEVPYKVLTKDPLFSSVELIQSSEWDVRLLNYFLEGTGRIGRYLDGKVQGKPWENK